MDINTKYNEGKIEFTKVWEEFLATQDVAEYLAALKEWKATEIYQMLRSILLRCCVDENKLTPEQLVQLKTYAVAKNKLKDSVAHSEFRFKRQLIKYLLVSDGRIAIPDSWCTNMLEIFDFDVNI